MLQGSMMRNGTGIWRYRLPDSSKLKLDRRGLLTGGALAVAGAAFNPALAKPLTRPAAPAGQRAVSEGLLRRALAALNRHQHDIAHRDVIGIADFAQPSSASRFHLVDVQSGATRSFLVAHGRGSDPKHRGWVERFSNEIGSNASSAGAYRTGDYYTGKHGRSLRLAGLEPGNSNAEVRAIVVHGAWYVSPDMVRDHGKLGRSEGCFAFSENDLASVLAQLGPSRLLYADKV